MFPFDAVFSLYNHLNNTNKHLLDSSEIMLCWKARLENFEQIESIIFEYMECFGTLVQLKDTYFNTARGLLKLRMFRNNRNGQLIYTETNDVTVPGLRESCTIDIEDGDSLKNILSLALGVAGTVQNNRRIFVRENIRICLDSVDQIGHFITASAKLDGSLESCLENLRSIQAIAQIDRSRLIYSSYLDLLIPLELTGDDGTHNSNDNDNNGVLKKRTATSSTSDECFSDQQSVSSESLVP